MSTLTAEPRLADITDLGPNEQRALILGTLDTIAVNEVLLMAPGDEEGRSVARHNILEARERLMTWAAALQAGVQS